MVYKATILEWRNSTDFQKLAWPFPFAKDGRHSSHTLLDNTHPMHFIDLVYDHSINYLPWMKKFNWFSKTLSTISLCQGWGTFLTHIAWWHSSMHFIDLVYDHSINYLPWLKEFNWFSKTRSTISLCQGWGAFLTHIAWWHTHPMHFIDLTYDHSINYPTTGE